MWEKCKNAHVRGSLYTLRKYEFAHEVRPAIVPFSFPESLHQGQRYNVLCTVSKGDAPVHITWYKDGVPVSTAGLASVSVLNVTEFSSTLIFEKLLPEHRGNYSCEARNEAGVVTVTSTMVIHGMA
ncbi:hypothetical protein MTO96_002493 [Rhipicephalus appendiculatus]